MRLSASTLGLGLFALACQPQAKPATDVSAAAAAEIRAADAAWLKVFAGHDTTATVNTVETRGSILAPNVPIATGTIAVKALFESFYALPNMSIHWTLTDAQASTSGDLGYSYGTYEFGFTDPKGNAIVDKGKYSTVWRKQADGTWKVVLDQFNSDLPLPGM